MSFDIRLPNIVGVTEKEQLLQIRSYLYQLAPQLNWALNTLESSASTSAVALQQNAVATTSAPKVDGKEEDEGYDFNELKNLIIKSADIVEAYYEEINKRLSGQYLAQSDFGSYYRDASANITANYEKLQLDFSDMQTIVLNEGDTTLIRSSTAYIRLGNVDTDDNGFPVHGIEIGQRNEDENEVKMNQFARFTARTLSFYNSSGTLLAEFGDEGMVVPEAKVKRNLTLGQYVLDTTNGLAFKWIGG